MKIKPITPKASGVGRRAIESGIKQCNISFMPTIKSITDYGPFRRCGCKRCKVILEKYATAPA